MASSRTRRALLIVVAAVAAVAVATGPAAAASLKISKGDAKAALKSIDSKAYAQAAIRPFEGGPDDGRHYCVRDWHTVVVGVIHGGDASFTAEVAEASFAGVSASFSLNSSPLATQKGLVQPYPYPSLGGWINAYYVQIGRILSPAELPVGADTLDVTITDPLEGVLSTGITFHIDAIGTGACG